MLHLALLPEEYLTIDGNIVVQLARISGSRAYLRLEADRSVPIVRGKLLERAGTSKPNCLASLPRSRGKRRGDALYFWNADRDRAVRMMEQILTKMEQNGNREDVQNLRIQLNHLLPTVWEEELSAKAQAWFHNQKKATI